MSGQRYFEAETKVGIDYQMWYPVLVGQVLPRTPMPDFRRTWNRSPETSRPGTTTGRLAVLYSEHIASLATLFRGRWPESDLFLVLTLTFFPPTRYSSGQSPSKAMRRTLPMERKERNRNRRIKVTRVKRLRRSLLVG